jgi:hypothetical protein
MKRAWNVCLLLLSIAGSGVTVLVAFQQWYPQAHPDARIAIIFLSVFVILVSAAAVWQEYRYARKARYAEALGYIAQVFTAVNARRSEQMSNVEEVTDLCRIVLNRLGRIFSLVTGTRCSTCIKVVVVRDGSERPQVATLCRDDTSIERETGRSPIEAWMSDLEDPNAVQHWIEENTDFAEVFRRAGTPQLAYISNDLTAEPFYWNTSFKVYGEPKRTRIPFLRSLTWPLPYRSTVVVPIGGRDNYRQYKLSGYLCVDSGSRYAFSRRYDVPLLTAAGENLNDLVTRYCELVDGMMSQDGDETNESE